MKRLLMLRITFLLLLFFSTSMQVSSQTGIFQGGIENGKNRASANSLICKPSTVSIFSGGAEEGKGNAPKNSVTCSSGVTNIFSGGSMGGNAWSAFIPNACGPEIINPFNGGNAGLVQHAGITTAICNPETVNLFGGGTGDGYSSVLDANADCFFSNATIISFQKKGCPGSAVLISGTGLLGVTQVLFNGVPASSFTINSSFSIWAVIPSNASTGLITLTGQGGTVSSADSIEILPAPSVSIDAESPVSLCTGPALLIALTTETQYLWSNGSKNSSISAEEPGSYWVTVTAANGCSATSDTIIVTPANFPSASFTYVQQNELRIEFSNTSINAQSYSWDFGNGIQSDVFSPAVEYNAPGTYLVQLIAENECGRDTFETSIVIVPTSLEKDGRTEVFVYPNPFRDALFIRISGNDPGLVGVNFFDVTGKLLLSQQLSTATDPAEINVSGLPSGIFNLQIRSEKGIINRKILHVSY